LGLKPGDRVASLTPNRIALIAHYLACLKAGLVTTPLNYRYTAPEIDHALIVSGAKIMLAHAERANDLAASKAASLPLGVITYGAENGGARSLEALLKAEPPPAALPALDPEAPAVIFFTSGSTGPAKGVTHSVNSLGWLIAAAAAAFEMTADDIVLPGSSCSHIGGFGLSLSALSVGAQAVVARSLDHAELGPLMRERRPTFLSMLPAALLSLIREEGTTADDFSRCVSPGPAATRSRPSWKRNFAPSPVISSARAMASPRPGLRRAIRHPASTSSARSDSQAPASRSPSAARMGTRWRQGRRVASGSRRARRWPAIGTTRKRPRSQPRRLVRHRRRDEGGRRRLSLVLRAAEADHRA
jgi:hypothetical protein